LHHLEDLYIVLIKLLAILICIIGIFFILNVFNEWK